jgi:hypothetical protein
VHLGIDMRLRLRTAADDEAVNVFAANLRDLLLAAPAGTRATLGLDPGFRTGVKVAVVDATGKVVATDVIYRTSRRTSGTRPSPSSRGSPRSTRSSWSRSATARRPARRTSSPVNSSPSTRS